jgi:hypothetical protein
MCVRAIQARGQAAGFVLFFIRFDPERFFRDFKGVGHY